MAYFVYKTNLFFIKNKLFFVKNKLFFVKNKLFFVDAGGESPSYYPVSKEHTFVT